MAEKKVFLVIGGSRGIGKATAILAARAGHPVVLTYASRPDAAHAVVAMIAEAGGRALAVRCDTASEADVLTMFRQAADFGTLGAVVYCTGVTGSASSLADAEAATLERVLAVNLYGAMLCGRAAVRAMAKSRGKVGGAIVFLSSRASAYGSANEFVWYAATKGGMDSLAIGLAREVAHEGIRVNLVSPGPIDTEMHRPGRLDDGASRSPMQRAGSPEEVAAAVLFLASGEASYVTGANLSVSGGL